MCDQAPARSSARRSRSRSVRALRFTELSSTVHHISSLGTAVSRRIPATRAYLMPDWNVNMNWICCYIVARRYADKVALIRDFAADYFHLNNETFGLRLVRANAEITRPGCNNASFYDSLYNWQHCRNIFWGLNEPFVPANELVHKFRRHGSYFTFNLTRFLTFIYIHC